MPTTKNYHLGLLYLVHLLISSDGIVNDTEKKALNLIRESENIPDEIFDQFNVTINTKKERDIYQEGIQLLNLCTESEKLNAFVHLYKLSEVDGNVHVKEVRLLLYSIKMTGLEFDEVVASAKKSA